MIRLFTIVPLVPDAMLEATNTQAHYLGNVMRRQAGDTVLLFNGRDGEWSARISEIARGKVTLQVQAQTRGQTPEADIWLMFALLKRDTTDLLVQKATELGVSALLPITTERTNAVRTNLDRLTAIAIEAAEQSERLTVPTIAPPRPLHQALAEWPSGRMMFAAIERSAAPALRPAAGPAGLLIGPEGGFDARDLSLLEKTPFVRPVSLGPRILRAETAAIAGLALLQAAS